MFCSWTLGCLCTKAWGGWSHSLQRSSGKRVWCLTNEQWDISKQLVFTTVWCWAWWNISGKGRSFNFGFSLKRYNQSKQLPSVWCICTQLCIPTKPFLRFHSINWVLAMNSGMLETPTMHLFLLKLRTNAWWEQFYNHLPASSLPASLYTGN